MPVTLAKLREIVVKDIGGDDVVQTDKEAELVDVTINAVLNRLEYTVDSAGMVTPRLAPPSYPKQGATYSRYSRPRRKR